MEPFACTDNNPSAKSVSMLNSSESKRQCPKRLRHFFNFLELQGELKDQSSSFVKQFKNKADEGEELEGKLLAFARYQKERVTKGNRYGQLMSILNN